MPIGKDTDRQGSGRIDRNTGEIGESINVEPYWANMHRFFSQSGGPDAGTPEREQWEAGKADIHRYMHTDQYTTQAADPDSDQHFPGHAQWKIDNPQVEEYTAEGTEGMWGDIKDAARFVTGRGPKQPEYDWDAPSEFEQDWRDLQYKDNPNVLSGEHGKAGGEDPLGWRSPKDKAMFRSQEDLKASLDPFDDSEGAQAIRAMRAPTSTSKESWMAQRKQSQDEWEAGAHEREYPHLYPDPITGKWPKHGDIWDNDDDDPNADWDDPDPGLGT